MPRSADGTYTAPTNTWNPAVDDTIVDPGDWNDTQDDYVDALTDSLSRTGDGGMLADLATGAFSVVLTERVEPASPAANQIALYSADIGGDTHILSKDSAGTVVDLTLGASAIGGSTGGADNALLTADGTGGSTLQATPVIVDGSGNMSAVGTLATTGAITQNGVAVLNAGVSGAGGQTIISGYVLTPYSYGNKAAASTITVDPSLGQHQIATLTTTGGAAVTVLAPSVEGDCILAITNGSGGVVTTPSLSGFEIAFTGDTFNTANSAVNWIFIYNVNGRQAYMIKNAS